VRDLH